MTDTTLKAAIREAYASAPPANPPLYTLELRHSAFTAPIRVVRNNAGLSACLEPSAPVDGGSYVDFFAFKFGIELPDVSAAGNPELTITLDNVDRTIVENIEKAILLPELIYATFRIYLPSDLSGPQNDPPMTMVIRHISADPFKVTARAGFEDLANMAFPRDEYNVARFPALAR